MRPKMMLSLAIPFPKSMKRAKFLTPVGCAQRTTLMPPVKSDIPSGKLAYSLEPLNCKPPPTLPSCVHMDFFFNDAEKPLPEESMALGKFGSSNLRQNL